MEEGLRGAARGVGAKMHIVSQWVCSQAVKERKDREGEDGQDGGGRGVKGRDGEKIQPQQIWTIKILTGIL